MSYPIKTIGQYIYFEVPSMFSEPIPLNFTDHYNYAIYWHWGFQTYWAAVFLTDHGSFQFCSLISNGNYIYTQYNSINELFANKTNIAIHGGFNSVISIDPVTAVLTRNNGTYNPLPFTAPAPAPVGAGSDPYITTFSGYTFELPHLNKWWNLFTHKSSDFSITAHTHNYSNGNFFNEIIINNGKSRAIIDYQKHKIKSKNSDFKVGKTKIAIKYKSEDKINEENKYFDYISFNHPEFKEVKFIINWRNHYFHPIFEINPIKDCSGLLMSKSPIISLKN